MLWILIIFAVAAFIAGVSALVWAASRADALNNRLDNEPDSTGAGGAAWVHDAAQHSDGGARNNG